MTASIKIQSDTVYAIGSKPLDQRKVLPLLRRAAFIGFLGSVFWAVPQVLDVAQAVYTDIKQPSVDAPVPTHSTVWLTNDEPIVWEEAAKDAFKDNNNWSAAVDFNTDMLLDLFETLDITQEQKLMIAINYKVASERYILGSEEPTLKAFFENRNAQSRQWLDEAWEKIQEQSLSGHTVTLQANEAVATHLNHYNLSLQQWGEKTKSLQQQSIADLFKQERDSVYRNAQERKEIPYGMQNQEIPDIQHAQELLRQAVDQTGLAALVVSGTVAHDEQLMYIQSQLLQQANVDLRRITGFDGGVLGVNRRMVLSNEHLNSNGTMERMLNGYIWVNSNWDTLGHEWFHALDAAQMHVIKGRGRDNYMSQSIERSSLGWFKDPYDLQSKQQKLSEELKNYTLSASDNAQFVHEVRTRIANQYPAKSIMMLALDQAAQEAADNGLPLEGSSWLHYRLRAVEIAQAYPLNEWVQHNKRNPNDVQTQLQWQKEKEYAQMYLQLPTEKMAFMFQGHLQALAHNNDIQVLSGDLAGQPGVYVPTVVESTRQIPLWNTYFTELKDWWNMDVQNRLNPLSVSKNTILEKRTTVAVGATTPTP